MSIDMFRRDTFNQTTAVCDFTSAEAAVNRRGRCHRFNTIPDLGRKYSSSSGDTLVAAQNIDFTPVQLPTASQTTNIVRVGTLPQSTSLGISGAYSGLPYWQRYKNKPLPVDATDYSSDESSSEGWMTGFCPVRRAERPNIGFEKLPLLKKAVDKIAKFFQIRKLASRDRQLADFAPKLGRFAFGRCDWSLLKREHTHAGFHRVGGTDCSSPHRPFAADAIISSRTAAVVVSAYEAMPVSGNVKRHGLLVDTSDYRYKSSHRDNNCVTDIDQHNNIRHVHSTIVRGNDVRSQCKQARLVSIERVGHMYAIKPISKV
ncbi:hypothetical protein BX661DRAFT_168228 [Kickxella alabastrina]|uniref:uncharacterized protein n=1 Tax=Kickxella alabastrina TaxID=61397 RepID=UPI00221FB979|nr:uncharacterized protein BX661DRAFT_168228 [Kickxella alabastrina]KAI7835056.1 hypothetical protein BX661DRAFT_168228 [Kickxella alabastrina]